MKLIRVAIVGCGAVAKFHAAAISRNPDCRLTALIDINIENARTLALSADSVPVFESFTDALPCFDACIVATPPQTHLDLASKLGGAGKHLLIEKPLALMIADCELISMTAIQNSVTVLSGQLRRFMSQNIWLSEILKSKSMPSITSIKIEDGWQFAWKAKSDYYAPAGGGVLADSGAHVVDLISWLFGSLRVVRYSDDNYGGIEAECAIQFETEAGIPGEINLSRLRNLSNRLTIDTVAGPLELLVRDDGKPLQIPDTISEIETSVGKASRIKPVPFEKLFDLQLAEWLAIINRGSHGLAPERVSSYVETLEMCYSSRQLLEQPWMK